MVVSATAGSEFRIQELTGQGRTVRLRSRGLPYRPFTVPVIQRVEVEWYPGSPEGVATITGSQEGETTVNGMWKEKYLADPDLTKSSQSSPVSVNGTTVASARYAVELFDDICRQGQLLEVQWDRVIRRGFLTKFEPTYENVYDVSWSMSFAWINRGQPTSAPVVISNSGVSTTYGVLQADGQRLVDASAPVQPTALSFMERVDAGVGKIEGFVNEVRDANETLARRAQAPAAIASRVLGACTSLVSSSQDLWNEMQSLPAEYTFQFPYNYSVSFGERLNQKVYQRGIVDQTTQIRRDAVDQRDGIQNQLQTSQVATYTARAGDDLRDVSRRFYGTADDWRTLMLYNGLTTSQLQAGQTVLVPQNTTGGVTS